MLRRLGQCDCRDKIPCSDRKSKHRDQKQIIVSFFPFNLFMDIVNYRDYNQAFHQEHAVRPEVFYEETGQYVFLAAAEL